MEIRRVFDKKIILQRSGKLLIFNKLYKNLLFVAFLLLIVKVDNLWAIEHFRSGVNDVLNISADARQSGLAGGISAMKGDGASGNFHASSLLDLQSDWVSFTHTSWFMNDNLDYVSASMPLSTDLSIGLSFIRFGSGDIPWLPEGSAIPLGDDFERSSIYEYVFSPAIARSWGSWRLGGVLHLLYRSLDQSGLGLRGDISGDYCGKQWRFSLDVRGVTTSAMNWDSGFEYSVPQVFNGVSYQKVLPYFYGTLQLGWQSASWFGQQGRGLDWQSGSWADTTGENEYNDVLFGEPITKDPSLWLQSSALAAEFLFDWGVSFRLGFQNIGILRSWTTGAGFAWNNWVRGDYAFQQHPALSGTHRVGISLSLGGWKAWKRNQAGEPRKLD